MTPIDIVAIKAFGDLVITLTALATNPALPSGTRLLLGEHLVPLADALTIPTPTIVVAHGEAGVPAIYDIRRCGAPAALQSAWRLRRLFRAARPEVLLFDRVGTRERWLAGSARTHALPPAENIYLAYAGALGSSTARPSTRPPANGIVGIFPGSRLASKNLPEPVVRTAIQAIADAGLIPRLLLLEGERPDLEGSGLPHEIVPRSFPAMIAAVGACGIVLSADSMPAHVAENRGIPVFVLSPVDNRYWLPLSAFTANRWALFSDDVAARTGQFLRAANERSA